MSRRPKPSGLKCVHSDDIAVGTRGYMTFRWNRLRQTSITVVKVIRRKDGFVHRVKVREEEDGQLTWWGRVLLCVDDPLPTNRRSKREDRSYHPSDWSCKARWRWDLIVGFEMVPVFVINKRGVFTGHQ